MLLVFMIAESEQYHVKSVVREVDISKGMFYNEQSKLAVSVKHQDHQGYFDYGVPFEFYNKVSSFQAKVDGESQKVEILVRNDLILPIFFYRIYFSKSYNEGDQFILHFTYNAQVDQFQNKYTSLFSPDQQADLRESERVYKDRTLLARFTSTLGLPYDVTTQTLKVKYPIGKLVNFQTESAPRQNTTSLITVGPITYQAILEAEYIDVTYYAVVPTLEVNQSRSVYPSGLPVRIGLDESQLGLVHIVDKLTFKNLDPSPIGLRRGRLDIQKLKQGQNRVIQEIQLSIPKAQNIRIYDRIGKVASSKIIQKQDQSIIVVTPRHVLFGQDFGEINIEYDTYLTQQTYQEYGFVLPIGPKIAQKSFFNHIETCIYPPSNGIEILFQSQSPFEFNIEKSENGFFDFKSRNGKCISKSYSDEFDQQKLIGVKWQIDQEGLENRFKIVFFSILAAFSGIWFIRCILQI